MKSLKIYKISEKYSTKKGITVMNKTDLHSSLLFLMIKLEEAKSNPMSDKNFVAALTEVLRFFRDNGELKKAYESQKESLTDMADGLWVKALKDYVYLKNQEDGVDAKFPDIDELIKKLASDEFVEKKIKDIPGDNDVDSEKEEQFMTELLFDIFLFSCTTAIGFIIGYYSRK